MTLRDAAPVAVPLSSVNLTALEKSYVSAALDSELISSTGPFVERFEQLIAAQTGAAYAIATSSGTCALQLILSAMDIGPGDEVLLPALTFASPALAVLSRGATPVFVDVEGETWTIDPAAAGRAITGATRAVIAVDVLGHPCDYDRLLDLGLPVVEDAAEAHGAKYRGVRVGSLGIAGIMSFHANKAITSGEGGCVVTNDPKIAERVRTMNSFGMDPQRRYWHVERGTNYRMSNLTAALATAQMERWDELIDGRRQVSEAYDRALAGLPVLRRPVAAWAQESVWLYTVASERRREILSACASRGVDARAIWPALPDNPVFRQASGSWPVAQYLSEVALWLPTWSGMSEEASDSVVEAVSLVFG